MDQGLVGLNFFLEEIYVLYSLRVCYTVRQLTDLGPDGPVYSHGNPLFE